MHGFDRILVYASLEDLSMLALERGAALARQYGARLSVLRVLPEMGGLASWLHRAGSGDQRRALEEAHRALLEEHAKRLREEGLDVETELRWGTPWIEIIETVQRKRHDLVLKVAEGAARGRGLYFGSTAMHLIRKCPCPVWILGGDEVGRPLRILAAIDPDTEGARPAVAEKVLQLAGAIAGDDCEVHAASVWRAAGETLLRSRMRPEELEAYVHNEKARASEGLKKALALAGDRVREENVHFLKGDPGDVLPRFVTETGFDLIVMGSLGRTGISGLLIGETAEALVRTVRCSVLVIKPPGFVCPVELRPTEG